MRLTVEEVIEQCLEHYSLDDASFLAECYFAQTKSDDALYLLCESYYKMGRAETVYSLLKLHGVKSAKTRFLFAKCCVDLEKLSEAELILTDEDPILSSKTNNRSIDERFGKSAPFARLMLANIYFATHRVKQAICELKACLKLNPFMWSAFERLCLTGENRDLAGVKEFFQSRPATEQMEPKLKQRRSPLSDTLERSATPNVPQMAVQPSCEPVVATPSPSLGQQILIEPEKAPQAPRKTTSRRVGQNEGSTVSSSNQRVTRQSSQLNVLGQNQTVTNARRSARLFQTSKENNSARAPRKSSSNSKVSQLNERNLSNSRTSTPLIITPEHESKDTDTIEKKQVKSLPNKKIPLDSNCEQLLNSLEQIGNVALSAARYDSETTLKHFASLPERLKKLAPVMVFEARAHFEGANYKKAVSVFGECYSLYEHYSLGTEYYSTALWHLQMENELSSLAQKLTLSDRNVPQTWCVVGNCFSLQKEHDTAIRFFQRAIQLNSDFTYAYTLLGHEYLATDDYTKAAQAFRSALTLNPRHYNAWYGLGLISYKQERLKLASVHFQRALESNPLNSVLLCHLAVVKKALGETDKALVLLERGLTITPNNALCRYHRAQLLFNKDLHKEALEELKILKNLAPKEPAVFFLACKVHKKLGETHLALMNLSWATELDPRGEQQNPLVGDRRYDEEPVTALAAIDPDEVGEYQQMDSDDTV